VPEGLRCWGQESSGAPKQAARQPDEVMSSRASGWASSQTRRCRAHERCAGRQAGAHRRGEDSPCDEVNGSKPPWRLAFALILRGVSADAFLSIFELRVASTIRLLRAPLIGRKASSVSSRASYARLLISRKREVNRKRSPVDRAPGFPGGPPISTVACCSALFGVDRLGRRTFDVALVRA
jgi:hypothetical protein